MYWSDTASMAKDSCTFGVASDLTLPLENALLGFGKLHPSHKGIHRESCIHTAMAEDQSLLSRTSRSEAASARPCQAMLCPLLSMPSVRNASVDADQIPAFAMGERPWRVSSIRFIFLSVIVLALTADGLRARRSYGRDYRYGAGPERRGGGERRRAHHKPGNKCAGALGEDRAGWIVYRAPAAGWNLHA